MNAVRLGEPQLGLSARKVTRASPRRLGTGPGTAHLSGESAASASHGGIPLDDFSPRHRGFRRGFVAAFAHHLGMIGAPRVGRERGLPYVTRSAPAITLRTMTSGEDRRTRSLAPQGCHHRFSPAAQGVIRARVASGDS